MSPLDETDAPRDEPENHAPDEPDVNGFTYACPGCGRRLEDYSETCPHCGADLGEVFSTTYRVPMSPAGRKIALAMLIGLALLLTLLVAGLLSQLLGTAPPAEGP
ncbi:MAG: zinc-ribbon domain-containing protein [Planctomycetota bacterium]|jgi:hypothetical protein